MPLEGFPPSRLPVWNGTEARVLCAPALGAQFAEYLLEIGAGGGTQHRADDRIETFLYILTGNAEMTIDRSPPISLSDGGFALVPASASFTLRALAPTTALMLRKAYEPAHGVALPPPVIGNQERVAGEVYLGNPGARLQVLIPDELPFDLAMNIFTFDVGHCLPYVETHVMEHGLYFLQGKGVYFLDDEWMEVEAGDFIWMGPYCPQSFYATGPVPSRYIYYKNVNRDVAL
jgi:(S)-ureidoglycine aminohydrolase